MLISIVLAAFGCADAHTVTRDAHVPADAHVPSGDAGPMPVHREPSEPPVVCNADGFCWEHPLPAGNAIPSIFTLSSDSIFAAGADGLLLAYDGSTWTQIATQTHADFVEVWASAPNDVWVAGNEPYFGIEPERRVRPVLLHFDGVAVTSIELPAALDNNRVRGIAGNEDGVWIAAGPLYRLRDGAFEQIELPGTPRADDVIALSASEVAVVAWAGGGLLTPVFVGGADGSWSEIGSVAWGDTSFGRLSRTEDGTLWIADAEVVFHDGTRFVAVEPWIRASHVAGRSPADFWTQGLNVTRHHHDGVVEEFGVDIGVGTALALDGLGSVLRAQGGGALERLVDGEFVSEFTARSSALVSSALDPESWGRIPPEIWAENADFAWGTAFDDVLRARTDASDSVIEHWDGASWTEVRRLEHEVTAMHGSASNNVWIVESGGTLYRWNGGSLEAVDPPERLGGIGGLLTESPSSTWIAILSASGEIAHWTGGRWEVIDLEVERVICDGLVQTPDSAIHVLCRTSVDEWRYSLCPVAGGECTLLPRAAVGFTNTHYEGVAASADGRIWAAGPSILYEQGRDELWTTGFDVEPFHFTPRAERVWVGPTDVWVYNGFGGGYLAMRKPL